MDFDWKPRDFGAVVQKVTSARGDMLGAMMRQVSRNGYLSCPPPAWDPEGLYRVATAGSSLEVQRLGEDNRWHACPIRPQGKRDKQQKFGILDAPNLLAADLTTAMGASGAALVYLDVDNFKAVNTMLTERVVDRTILPELQRLVDSVTREHGHAYAEGGDEVIVLLPNTSPLMAVAFAESLRERVERTTFHADARTLKLTLSLGVSWTVPGVPIEELPDRANRAKAYAKANGKNVVALHEEASIRLIRLRYDAAPTSVRGPFIRPR